MDEARLDALLSEPGQAALAAATALAPAPTNSLACLSQLRKHFPAQLATDALETALLREKAKTKFANASGMYFTREALEMASSETVARYRAARFARFPRVLDLCCGIGGDTIALAAAGCEVVTIDSDPVRLRMAELNLAANGLTARFERLDVLADPLPEGDAAFADPGRRAEGKRYLSLKDYLPPPAKLVARFPKGFPLAFKLAPGIAINDLAEFDGEAEFLQVDGELKECVLWLGSLGTPGRRATLLGSSSVLSPSPSAGEGLGVRGKTIEKSLPPNSSARADDSTFLGAAVTEEVSLRQGNAIPPPAGLASLDAAASPQRGEAKSAAGLTPGCSAITPASPRWGRTPAFRGGRGEKQSLTKTIKNVSGSLGRSRHGELETLFAATPPESAEAEPIRAILYDPAPAVVRAGLVPALADLIGGTPTDATVQMLSADEPTETPFATAYRVEAVLPFDSRKVQAWLKSHGIGRVTVVKRGAMADAAAVAEKWTLTGSEHRFVIVTRQCGEQVAVVGARIEV